jgi:hypothetical protein
MHFKKVRLLNFKFNYKKVKITKIWNSGIHLFKFKKIYKCLSEL